MVEQSPEKRTSAKATGVTLGICVAICAAVLGIGGTAAGRHAIQNSLHAIGLAKAYAPAPTAEQQAKIAKLEKEHMDNLIAERNEMKNFVEMKRSTKSN